MLIVNLKCCSIEGAILNPETAPQRWPTVIAECDKNLGTIEQLAAGGQMDPAKAAEFKIAFLSYKMIAARKDEQDETAIQAELLSAARKLGQLTRRVPDFLKIDPFHKIAFPGSSFEKVFLSAVRSGFGETPQPLP